MPKEATHTWVRTRDGRNVAIGGRAFDTYSLRSGTIVRDHGDGWFDFVVDDQSGETILVAGIQLCSIQWAEWRYVNYL